MEYKSVELNCDVAVGKTFEFPTSEIQTTNYSEYYSNICQGYNPSMSFGIYEVGKEVTNFTVAIQTEFDNNYSPVKIPGGNYFEFEIDLLENQKENQYTKCFDTLAASGERFNMEYSFEVMDRTFNPKQGNWKIKYYIKEK